MRLANASGQCQACCFYRLIELDSRRARELCALTGEKRPMAGMAGCNFLAGAWSQLDAILRLPKSRLYGNTGLPNQTELGSGFFRNGKIVAKTKNIAIVDFIGKPIKTYRKRQFVRPGDREAPVARLARERTSCLFHV